MEKRHKSRVHKLLPRHIAERCTNSRKHYEKHLAGEKWKFLVTLDEAYVYLGDCNKPQAIYYREGDERKFQKWYAECRESFSKGFMFITGYCYNGKLTICRVAKKAKINSQYYQEEVLTPIYRTEILAFLERMEQETGIHAIPFSNFPVKSPDATFVPLDSSKGHWETGVLEQETVSGKRGEWELLDMAVLCKSLLKWKL
ncbi:hypothetical protein L9F63_005189 [Diploptera punctata]|uniref:Uncharacterized protein n=1 Tax=Diploptera punctata TaxID=6984 RepID=A0AAD7ZE14_DIPPU|nr:hypothetical protein L9F63_005189 [Diploptera punctata]